MTWVQAWEFELLLKTLASVCPAVLRIWASSQSYWQALPEQRSSVVAGLYQKRQASWSRRGDGDRLGKVLSPLGSVAG